ncbi:hypothetical protein BCR36DRAFT_323349 [Piromyces finnis]|uniref:Aminopeptidase n=1 Tax=Piromyces finnis TaxID=1754191 RepID=A0A1Y1VE70_9FUNG|nr:hypothetical protein BCR36DRAFT_323349 [Piromyces finnis]|eukprot:ORX53906.1 hypothetical protein BCR36DRAFT_323349 [Piromyces finnis]
MSHASQLEKLLPEDGNNYEDFTDAENIERDEDGVWIESDYHHYNGSFINKINMFLRMQWPQFKRPVIYSTTALLLFFIFFVPMLNHKTMSKPIYTDIRLPKTVVPKAYRLDFSTSLENVSFQGIAEIDVEVKEETNFIVIHSQKLNLSNIKIINGKKKWKAKSIKYNEKNQYAILSFNTILKPELNYTLSIQYSGILSDDMSGYYLSKYGDNDNPSYLATTQFESTSARKAFPCFDEPEFKATFQLNMTVGAGLTAISNMNVVDIEKIKNSEKKKYIFANSTKMSTYLVAFIVSNFKSITKSNKGIDISVYARPEQIESTEYALEVATKILRFYESTYDIPYPLPKLDLVAIPDFEAGAMENWGLITFRETALLYDEKSASSINKQYVATVVAHELAHQWFGNLVTMKWWDDLWLNEGFAEFMEYLGVNAAEPEWGMENHWYYMDVIKAFKTDSSHFTHPIYAEVKDPEEISGLFDDISYSKGSSVIRMIESWLNNINSRQVKRSFTTYSSNYFFNRIHKYLDLYQYNNAETKQLWDALESYDKDGEPLMNVSETMGTFINQGGYPIIMMKENKETSTIALSQERYFVNNMELLNDKSPADNSTWIIPYSYLVYSNTTGKPEILENKSITLKEDTSISLPRILERREEGKNVKVFVKGNTDQTGFYKVQYDDESIQIACEWLKSDLYFMTAIDRAGFLYDISSQLFNGRTENPEVILDCLNFLKNEKSNVVWQSAIDVLRQLLKNFDIHASYGNVKKYVISLIQNIANDIGWEETTDNNNDDNDSSNNPDKIDDGVDDNNDDDDDNPSINDMQNGKKINKFNENNEISSGKYKNELNKIKRDDEIPVEDNTVHNRSQLRAAILGLACTVGEPKIKSQALDYFEQIKNGTFTKEFSEDVLSVIYTTGIRYGNENDFNFIFEAYKKETSVQLKNMLQDSLASVTLPYLQEKLFEISISDEIREQDTNFLLMRLIRSVGSSAARQCWIFVKEHWNSYFIDRFPTGTAGFSRLLGTISEYLNNKELFDEIIEWVSDDRKHSVPSNSKVLVQRGVEIGSAGNYWTKHEKFGEIVVRWLKENFENKKFIE